jgi:N utilization substance protein B
VAARRKARKRALDVLFAAEARDVDAADLLVEVQRRGDPVVQPYAAELVLGVTGHRAEIDRILGELSREWPLRRMPAVDRALLRIAAFEILYQDDVPAPVAVSEAVGLATDLSTDDSAGFISGVLSGLIRRTESQPPSAPDPQHSG